MSAFPRIQIDYAPVRSYANVVNNFIGAQAVAGQRGTLPTFTDANTYFVAKTGSDGAAGTAAAPFLTIGHALASLTGAFVYACVLDSGVYDEVLSVAFSAGGAGGLYAADGQTPTITKLRGAVAGTYGARRTGRTKFYAGAHYCYVSKAGNDGTGVRDDVSHPFLTIMGTDGTGATNGALKAASSGDCIQIQDDGTYVEDINCAAKALTIQARDGYVPVLTTSSGAGGTHLTANAGVAVNVYGITFRDPELTTFPGYCCDLTGGGDFYDCMFIGNSNQLHLTGAKTYSVMGCTFFRSFYYAIFSGNDTATTTMTVQNCRFTSCCEHALDATLVFAKTGGASVLTVRQCDFMDDRGIQGAVQNASGNMTLNLYDSRFECTLPSPGYAPGVNVATLVENCYFYRLGGMAVHGATTARHCTAIQCGRYGAQCDFDGNATLEDSISLDSSFVGINGLQTQIARRCSVIRAADTGYGPQDVIDCLEYGSGNYSLYDIPPGGGAGSGLGTHISYCIFQTPLFSDPVVGPPTIGDSFYQLTDARFVSTVSFAELVGFSAASLAIFSASDGLNMGPRWPLLTITAANHPFVVDGITFDGDPYFNDGVLVPSGVNSLVTISHCTFTRLMGFGMWLDSGASASDCYVNVNGLGAVLAGGVGTVANCVFDRCGSAGVFVGTIGPTVSHVTAYGCEYGQYDFATGGGAAASSNVLSGNGTDYSGSGDQAYSLVGTVVGGGTATNGDRRDARFRDLSVDPPDLRLQSVEYGYPYDSPAKALALDTSDAGAYDITYGPLVETWTTIDFGAATFINPFHVEHVPVTIKLATSQTYGGMTNVLTAAVKIQHTLRWKGAANMSAAQTVALVALFSSPQSECQITFDGRVTMLKATLMKDSPPTYQALGYYNSTGKPEAIDMLVFLEST